MTQPRPNILLNMADQWRGDRLGSAGYPEFEPPHLDELFYNGVSFRHAYSAAPTCNAPRATLMTGVSQRSQGRVGYADNVPWDYPVTLPGLFADAGYHTQCVGKMHVSPERSLIGFHNVVLHDGALLKHPASANYKQFDDYRRFLRSQSHADTSREEGYVHDGNLVVGRPQQPSLQESRLRD